MGVLSFLSALPAVLGLTGFVIYFFLVRNRQGDQITQSIIAKLRRDAPAALPPDAEKLSPTALERLILRDKDLEQKVNQDEFGLLRSSLKFQFILSLVVYCLCALFFLAGIYLFFFFRPSVSSISVSSVDPAAKGLPVDLDRLAVRWSSSGSPADLRVSLKNLDSGEETNKKNVSSKEGVVEFARDDYASILRDRRHNGSSRLLAIVRTPDAEFTSSETKLFVGTTIVVAKMSPTRLKIMGTVNDTAIDYYNFEGQFLVWLSDKGHEFEPVTIPSDRKINYGKNDFPLDPKKKYDWSHKNFLYLSPDDPRIVRVEYIGLD
jgi:hypothetical protein